MDSSNLSSNNGSESSINFNSVNGNAPVNPNGNGIDSNYIIEDVIVPFDSGNGLFDLFSSKSTSDRKVELESNGKIDTPNSHENEVHEKENGNLNSINDNNMIMLNDPRFSNASDSEDLDMVENMFPLFPLVGSCSFDDSKSLPMTQIPVSPKTHHPFPKAGQNPAVDLSEKRKSSSASLSNQSRPFVPISSTSSASSHHQPLRPKRPESALSIASNSSNLSSNVHENANNSSLNFSTNFNFPTQNTSSAYPPIDFTEEDFSDDQNSQLQKLSSQRTVLQQNQNNQSYTDLESNIASQVSTNNINNSSINGNNNNNGNDNRNSFFDSNDGLNDPYDLRLVSYEDFLKNLNKSTEVQLESPASITPQSSSIPSRQPLQNNYKRTQDNYQIHNQQQSLHHQQLKTVPQLQPLQSSVEQQLEQQLFEEPQQQQPFPQLQQPIQPSSGLVQNQQQYTDYQDLPQYLSSIPDSQYSDFVPPMLSDFISPATTDKRDN